MKQLFPFVTLVLVLFLGCNKLKDKTLNDNPYDKDYIGPNVLHIDSFSTYKVDSTHYRNRIYITSLTQNYQGMILYRNGLVIGGSRRYAFGSGNSFNEILYDFYPVLGVTYSYQAKLTYDSGFTSLSDAVSYTTR